MSSIQRLSAAASGIHLADQIALVSVPLIAALVFDATPATIGVLVACQSMAHLVGSVPFGVLVDQKPLRSLVIAAALIALTGGILAVLSILSGNILMFGGSVTLAGFGTVLFGLVALSVIPRCVGPQDLGRANAAIEVPRAVCSFLVPLVVGLVLGAIPAWMVFAVACTGAVLALLMAGRLPAFDQAPRQNQPVLRGILEGGRHVLSHRLLLPIALCAVFWNLAFAALLVALVPAIQEIYGLEPGSFGIALAAFGLAAICGSWLSGRIANRVAPWVLLLFGPACSLVASAGLLVLGLGSSAVLLYALFFVMGFGPSMWLVVQNSVRQLVTPPELLGRVNAVIQTAIYGVRPLGAVLGGVWATGFGVGSALQLVCVAFAASFAVALFSDLRHVGSYRALRA